MPKLVVITHGLGNEPYVLSADLTTIGRAAGNNIQIAEASISARHCEVRLRGNELLIRDLDSTNGTFIMGERVTYGVLRLGQILRLGQVELRLQVSVPQTEPADQGQGTSAQKTEAVESQPLTVTPARKFQVLLVDDSLAFVETVGSLFNILSNNTWEIHTATAADRALAILQHTAIDLVVLDLGMPVLDGVQLLGMIHRRYPYMKKAILSGEANRHNRAVCLERGAEVIIDKPAAADGLKAVFTVLNDLVMSTPQRHRASGVLCQVALQDILQMECLLRNSSVLEVRTPRLQGEIFIEHGTILHATAGTMMGEEALYTLLSVSGGQFRAYPFKAPSHRTIQGTWDLLLMEAARRRDETAVILLDDTKRPEDLVADVELKAKPRK